MTLRNPVPTGVAIGPFRAVRFLRIDSMTRSGSGVPSRAATAAPASWMSHSIWAPVAAMTIRAASDTSGPIPSPGISVTR